jgi:hypothetical protein
MDRQQHVQTSKTKQERFLFTLPSDLLQFLFYFLAPEDLCRLDSAILNHAQRPLFLSALVGRFRKLSSFLEYRSEESLTNKSRWYLCREIPVETLCIHKLGCPTELISMNSNSLKEIVLFTSFLSNEDFLALGRCSGLSTFYLSGSSFFFSPQFDMGLLLPNLINLRVLDLIDVPWSRSALEVLTRSCRSLASLQLSSVDDVGDEEFRCLIESFPALCTLRLSKVDITEGSVQMLSRCETHSRTLVGIRDCNGVTLATVLSLLTEVTIPHLFRNDNEKLQIDTMLILTFSTTIFPLEAQRTPILRFFSRNSLLERLVELLAIQNGVRLSVISYLWMIAEYRFTREVIKSGAIPALISNFPSFNNSEKDITLLLLEYFSIGNSDHHPYLLSSGILSVFRPHLLQVND